MAALAIICPFNNPHTAATVTLRLGGGSGALLPPPFAPFCSLCSLAACSSPLLRVAASPWLGAAGEAADETTGAGSPNRRLSAGALRSVSAMAETDRMAATAKPKAARLRVWRAGTAESPNLVVWSLFRRIDVTAA